MTELIVAATLLVSAIGTAVPLAIAARRVQRDARHYRLAVGELSNQLERLGSLDAEQRDVALGELTPSDEIREVLVGATLRGEILRDDDGTRLVLTLNWQRPAGAVPLRLVGWLDALPADTAETSPEQSEEAERL